MFGFSLTRIAIYAALIVTLVGGGYSAYAYTKALKAENGALKQDSELKTQQLLQLDKDKKAMQDRLSETIEIQKKITELQQKEILILHERVKSAKLRIDGAKTLPEKEAAINDSFQRAVWCIEQISMPQSFRDKDYVKECSL